jgi:hypothetical protein
MVLDHLPWVRFEAEAGPQPAFTFSISYLSFRHLSVHLLDIRLFGHKTSLPTVIEAWQSYRACQA